MSQQWNYIPTYHFNAPKENKKDKTNQKKEKKKTSVTYNIYTKCKEALHNIMLFFKIVVQKNNHHFFIFIHASKNCELEHNSGPTLNPHRWHYGVHCLLTGEMFCFSFFKFSWRSQSQRMKVEGPVKGVSAVLCSSLIIIETWWPSRCLCVCVRAFWKKKRKDVFECVCMCMCVHARMCLSASVLFVVSEHTSVKKNCKKAKWASSYEKCVSGTKRTECCAKWVFFFLSLLLLLSFLVLL